MTLVCEHRRCIKEDIPQIAPGRAPDRDTAYRHHTALLLCDILEELRTLEVSVEVQPPPSLWDRIRAFFADLFS